MTTAKPVSLPSALLAAQRAMPAIQKDAINPHFRNRYVSLDSLLPPVLAALNEHGIVLSQFPTTLENGADPRPALRTRLTHAESGDFIEDTMLLLAGKNDPQGQGSAITYARRYALMAILGLVADEDDDGSRAINPAGEPSRTTAAREPSPAAAASAAPRAAAASPAGSQFKAPDLSGQKATKAQLASLIELVDELIASGHMTSEQLQSAAKTEVGWPDMADKLSRAQVLDLTGRLERFRESVKAAEASKS